MSVKKSYAMSIYMKSQIKRLWCNSLDSLCLGTVSTQSVIRHKTKMHTMED